MKSRPPNCEESLFRYQVLEADYKTKELQQKAGNFRVEYIYIVSPVGCASEKHKPVILLFNVVQS